MDLSALDASLVYRESSKLAKDYRVRPYINYLPTYLIN